MNDFIERERARHERTLALFTESGVTQREFTRRTGFSKSQWYAWFSSHRNSGSRLPSLAQFAKICETYNFSASWILSGAGPKYLSDLNQTNLREEFLGHFDELTKLINKIRGT